MIIISRGRLWLHCKRAGESERGGGGAAAEGRGGGERGRKGSCAREQVPSSCNRAEVGWRLVGLASERAGGRAGGRAGEGHLGPAAGARWLAVMAASRARCECALGAPVWPSARVVMSDHQAAAAAARNHRRLPIAARRPADWLAGWLLLLLVALDAESSQLFPLEAPSRIGSPTGRQRRTSAHSRRRRRRQKCFPPRFFPP